MQLENSFTVPVPIDEAWRVLLDIERIAPCMPGAALDSVTGDDFTGRVKVKLGPINLTYQGKASFVEKDEAAHKAVIDARGKDQRGNGTAAAVVTAQLKPEGDATRVDVLTDLNITGRPAQFGRGVMTDVGNKLLGQFADKLAAQLGAGESAPEPSAPAKAAATAGGAVEEVAAAAEQAAPEGPAKKAAAATKKAAASTTDRVTANSTVPAKSETPEKAAPAKKAAPATPAAAAPSTPAAPATAPTAVPSRPRPVSEPEPIDLLEVAGGAAVARYAKPAAGLGLLLLLIFLVARRRRD
ncbi:SRPBCC family protein [Petropleomorpha daqingensis]|uniref:Carbon monoxide dehydrogenase subunit G n=1 Tax=Petropleomorpha daqingensis TaxID=2026353 RepID=A0A853CFX9_9ACTN|nr:carbon monoxide dehydrogenase subunit G [Petropleomorpha daqingensis]